MPAEARAEAIYKLADLLVSKQSDILDANGKDITEAQKANTSGPLLDRLKLSPSKLKNLSVGK